MEERLNSLETKLGLDYLQKIQLRTLKEGNQDEMKVIRNEMRIVSKEIREPNPKVSNYTVKLANISNHEAELGRDMMKFDVTRCYLY